MAMFESAGQHTASVTTTGSGTVVVASTANKTGRFNGYILTASATGVVTIYDNASTNSGTLIGYIASGTVVGTAVFYDVPFSNGIAVYDAGAGGQVITFIYSLSSGL
jgi:hypothetical protein